MEASYGVWRPLLTCGLVFLCWRSVLLEWKLGIASMAILTVAAGYCTTEQTWGAVDVVLMPVLFLGSEGHGRGGGLGAGRLFPVGAGSKLVVP